MNNGLLQVGALNGEGKHFKTEASNISGSVWCAQPVSGSEEEQSKDAAERGQ